MLPIRKLSGESTFLKIWILFEPAFKIPSSIITVNVAQFPSPVLPKVPCGLVTFCPHYENLNDILWIGFTFTVGLLDVIWALVMVMTTATFIVPILSCYENKKCNSS